MPVKLIIFDLDGTLVDTVQDITDALSYALQPHGIKPLEVMETVELVGEGVTRLVEKVLPADKSHLRDNVMDKFLEYYSDHLTDYSREYPVLYVISRLGVSPQESIIVGDSNFDIEAGKKAGIKTVGVTYGYRTREFLEDADYLIGDIRELVALLQAIRT